MHPAFEALTPEQRLEKGLCPETGESLQGKSARARRDQLWPKQPKKGTEARRRYDLLTSAFEKFPDAPRTEEEE